MTAIIDETQAVFGQIHKLSHEEYIEWTYKPSKQRSFTMFESPFLERCSKSSFSNCILSWIMLISTCSWYIQPSVASTIAGVMIWTGMEYSIHRFIFHSIISKTLLGRYVHFIIHGCHHRYPNDHERLSSAFVAAPFVALSYYLLKAVAMTSLLPGIIIGGCIYDIVHYSHHVGWSYKVSWLWLLAKLHMKHHYIDNKTNFGVNSCIWDKLFGTYKLE